MLVVDDAWADGLVGEMVGGRYAVLESLGRGGSAAVLAASDTRTGRDVALKLIHPWLREGDVRERFRRETELLISIDHPAVVRVFEAGDDPVHGPYLAMQRLSGMSFLQALSRGGLPLGAALAVIDRVCGALSEIHTAGFIHRDLTPGNIFLRLGLEDEYQEEAVKLLDFGIAKVLGSRWEALTTQGVALGTPRFMASEQARGEVDTISEATDICALGRILYLVCANEAPYATRRGYAVLRAIARGEPMGDYTRLPKSIASVVTMATHARPGDRFASVGAFRAAMRDAIGKSYPSTGLGPEEVLRQTLKQRTPGEDSRSAEATVALSSTSLSGTDGAPPPDASSLESTVTASPGDAHVLGPNAVGPNAVGPNVPSAPRRDATSSAEDWLVGGRYRLLARLDAGGMGTVFRAQHVVSHRIVALKLMSLAPTDGRDGSEAQELRTRFEAEARAVSQFAHPSLVRVMDAGVDEDGPDGRAQGFIVMELLEGESLSRRMAAGALPLAELKEVSLALAEALRVLHAAGVVHRDLKPANVFLARGHDLVREVKVLDFGITKSGFVPEELSDSKASLAPKLMGTPAYMSPEQILNPDGVGPPGDVWSFGVILYKALSGRLPFPGPGLLTTMSQVMDATPESLAKLRPDLAPEWSILIHRCLDKTPGSRYADGRALRDAIAGLPESASESAPQALGLEGPTSGEPAASPLENIVNIDTAGGGFSGPFTDSTTSMTQTKREATRSGLLRALGIGIGVAVGLLAAALLVFVGWKAAQPGRDAEEPEPGVQAGVDAGRRQTPADVLRELIEEDASTPTGPEELLRQGRQLLEDGNLLEAEGVLAQVIADEQAASDIRAWALIYESRRQLQRVELRLAEMGRVDDDQVLRNRYDDLSIHIMDNTLGGLERVGGELLPGREPPLVFLQGVSEPLRACAWTEEGITLERLVDAAPQLSGTDFVFGDAVSLPRFPNDSLDAMARYLFLAHNQYRKAVRVDSECRIEAERRIALLDARLDTWEGRHPLITRYRGLLNADEPEE